MVRAPKPTAKPIRKPPAKTTQEPPDAPDEKPAHPPHVATQVRLLENMFAPELYADEATSFAIGPGVIKLTFSSLRWDYSNSDAPEQRRVVTGRVVLPIPGVQALAAQLVDFLRGHGISVATAEERKRMQ